MILSNINPTETLAWKALEEHFCKIKKTDMKELFSSNASRVDNFHVKWNAFLLDYSKNRIDNRAKELLLELVNEINLKKAINSYYKGENINETEDRAVLHMALRAKETETFLVNGVNVVPEVFKVKKQLEQFSNSIINGNLKGNSGKAFTDIINIGIGGSDLGPSMVIDGLSHYKNHLKTHFISNADADYAQDLLKHLDPETTLVVVVSKTFTTRETINNAHLIKNWLLASDKISSPNNHFVAVTANVDEALSFGVNNDFIFPIWDWVGGRFSLWSAVGLTISLNLGFDNFEKLLKGANKMDLHFKESTFDNNIPVLLALIGVWNNNFLKAETEAIIPYSQYLQKLPSYLQQSVMESNGKNIDRNSNEVNYQTSQIVWGEPGTNAQHAFFQLFHQGTKIIPVDLIGFKEPLSASKSIHNEFMANFFAQSEALLKGKSLEEAKNELTEEGCSPEEVQKLAPFKVFKGNKPSNTILIDKLTPENLGSLIAIYEHKIFVQGIIWNIFSYDQWGVELGKTLASTIIKELNSEITSNHDASTSFLLNEFKK
ncbi:MAG: glucose-6-phosphate isomerase [Flavobacterium sp.]|jgi:glucose-6-phosphate isomerase